MIYAIHEANMERFNKHMTRIRNKCEKYGCEFKCKEVGEEFRKVNDDKGKEDLARFVLMDVEGTAMLNDWEFIAELEHTKNGNIIKKVSKVEVPERYYNTPPVCEHCGTNRYRKNTYVVHNIETDEFRQVGKSCLMDFTHGLSAEGIAPFLAGFDKLAEFETPPEGNGGWDRYVERDMFLRYVAETVRLCGYVKRREDIYDEINPDNTLDKATMIMDWREKGRKPLFMTPNEIEARIPSGFNADGERAREIAQSAYDYVRDLEGNNNYVHNLRTVMANDYVAYSNLGLLASAIPYYNRYVERCEEENRRKKEMQKEAEHSDYLGAVGDRVKDIPIIGVRVVWSGETQFGYHFLYKMVDQNANVLIWSTGKELPEENFTITGTIKELKEYNGVKETVMTRCKIGKGA